MQIFEQESDNKVLKELHIFKKLYPTGVVVIYWPTATGKSSLSLRLATHFQIHKDKTIGNIEVISADSRQVYRFMDIGTDKVSWDLRTKVPHHLIDIIEPDADYTAHQWQQDTKKICSDILSRWNLPIIVWGTWLYIDTIYKNFNLPADVKPNRARRHELEQLNNQSPGYARNILHRIDPDTAIELHPSNIRYIIRAIEIYETTGIPKSIIAQEHPVEHPLLMISLSRSIEQTNTLIKTRVIEMINQWLIEEVKSLLSKWYSSELQSMNGIGYRQTVAWLRENSNDKNLLIDSISLATTQFSKRQRTRFRRYKKDAQEHPKYQVRYLDIDL